MCSFVQLPGKAWAETTLIVALLEPKDEGQGPHAVLLCVDDDLWFLHLTKWVLESNGYRVLTAANGREALDVFRASRVDLVVVDYQMPGMNGYEVALKIKGVDPHIPVVLQSAALELPEEVIRVADAFVAKEGKFHLLMTVIAKLITHHRNNGHHAGRPTFIP